MLDKKDMKGKCPFRNFKECRDDCVFYRRGTRTIEHLNGSEEVIAVELCAVNVIADNIERMHNRTYMLQKEMGETKNVMAFHVMADLRIASQEEAKAQAEKVLIPIAEKIRKKELPEK